VTVIEVVDGDTMTVEFSDGHRETVRLLGVDTPETGEVEPSEYEGIPDTQNGRQWLSKWAEKAAAFSRVRIEGERVRIQVDGEADRRGTYGRLLVYLYHDGGGLLNLELMETEHARFYDTAFSKHQTFADVATQAQVRNVGIWNYSGSTPTTTAESSSGLVLETVHADANGNDHENENDEYVAFENAGDETLDLSGWTAADAAGHTYRFPDGFALEPGATVTLYTGSGEDTDAELYWGSDGAIWNNGEDRITVTTDDGETVVNRSYAGG
jgi:endonuclease YncB( thermonuclease family)